MTILKKLRPGSGSLVQPGPDSQTPTPVATAIVPRTFMAEDTWAKRFGAWGSLFTTAVIFALLTIGLIISSRVADPPSAFTNLMETVKALAMIAAGFWLGSSNSSQKKDDTIAQGTAALAVSTPPGVVNGTVPATVPASAASTSTNNPPTK